MRRLRLERGLSQERLAELADLINYKHIGSIELSKVEPCAEVLIRLAQGLKVPVGELFETITPMQSHGHRLSPADLEAILASLENLTTIFDRVRAGQPPPVPRRAPRRPHR
ncbi:MAG: helix-turn-helix domain-containing protein [Vicinamibacteraceae bacterium]